MLLRLYLYPAAKERIKIYMLPLQATGINICHEKLPQTKISTQRGSVSVMMKHLPVTPQVKSLLGWVFGKADLL